MIYLDYAASSPPFFQVVSKISQISLEAYGNPGGIHGAAETARGILQESRRTLASLLGVRDREVFFTSGGTEANNWAVKLGCRLGCGNTILVSATEHKSVLESAYAMEAEGFRVRLLYPDRQGKILPEALADAITPDTALVCIQAVNNETGVLQDIDALARITKARRIPFLCDAVQSFGHVSQPLHRADLITVSAHKFGGPRGIGCLAVRYPYSLRPLIHGGNQEMGLRSGTENLPGIAGLALAGQLAATSLPEETARLRVLSELLLQGIRGIDSRIEVNGCDDRQPGILNLYFPGISGEAMAVYLNLEGICVSPGAACGARESKPSHVLLAMGHSDERARNSVRFSLGRNTTEEEIRQTVSAVEKVLRQRRKEL